MKKANGRSKQSSPVDASNEKQQYEERIHKLGQKNKAYQLEIEELKQKYKNNSVDSDNAVEKLKKEYLKKLNILEQQVTELKRKLDSQSQFSTQRKRVDETTRQLQFEIQSLKAQKVQLQCKIKLESVQFRLCRTSLEKEVLQLKKERRRNEYEIHKLLTSNERLKMVLQRKTEEASTATKRLREMIELRKSILNRSSGARDGNNTVIQAAEHEFEVTAQLHELCSQYESQMERMAEEIANLKEEVEVQRQEKLGSQFLEEDSDCLEKDSDIKDLKEQINSLACHFRQLRLQKEKLNSKDTVQDMAQTLLSDGSFGMLLEKIDNSEANGFLEAKREKTAEGVCCSCSKRALCKTTKCKCRSTGEGCKTSCGCTLFKCQNREPNSIEAPKSDSAIDQMEYGSIIASEGAKLLRNALVEKTAHFRDNPGPINKPLCDIQNSLGQLDVQIRGKKKKAPKPTIKLVTKDPNTSLPENNSSHSEE